MWCRSRQEHAAAADVHGGPEGSAAIIKFISCYSDDRNDELTSARRQREMQKLSLPLFLVYQREHTVNVGDEFVAVNANGMMQSSCLWSSST